MFHYITCLSKHCISLYIQFRIITCHIRNITKCVCQIAVLAVLICMCVNTCICMVDRWPNMLLSLTPQRSFAFWGSIFREISRLQLRCTFMWPLDGHTLSSTHLSSVFYDISSLKLNIRKMKIKWWLIMTSWITCDWPSLAESL